MLHLSHKRESKAAKFSSVHSLALQSWINGDFIYSFDIKSIVSFPQSFTNDSMLFYMILFSAL